jgi:cobalt-zinc-cadmium efflux system membrane fusion protein
MIEATNSPQQNQGWFPSRWLAVAFGIAVLAAGSYHLALVSSGALLPPGARVTAEKAPLLIRENGRITVPEGSPLRDKLSIAPVQDIEFQRTLTLPATVEADPARLVKVLPPLAGRVTQLFVQLGERVVARQPLLILDSPDLAAAQADHERAKVLLDLALKNRDRLRDLAKIGGAAVRDMQQAETDYVTAEVEHQRADARLRQIGVNPETTDDLRTVTLTAPVNGSIIDLDVAPGSFWNDPNSSLMTITDLSTVWVTANVPERDTSFVSKGQSVEVAFAAYPNEIFKGDVLFVSDILDPDTRRTKVRIPFPNPDIRLKPGMFANANFLTPKQTVMSVPTAALVLKNDGDVVFVEIEPWTFEVRPVETSFQQGDQTIIKSGVRTGERIVVKGGVLLND